MTDAIQNNSPETVAVSEPKLTQREKLMLKYTKLADKAAALTTEINAVVNEISEIDKLDSITVGTQVIVSIGKGEAASEVVAVVVGVKDDEDGSKVYKVQYGTGFDADIAVVKQGKIKVPNVVPAAE